MAVSNLDHLFSVIRIKERPALPENLGNKKSYREGGIKMNHEDVCVNQRNLDCIIVHSA